MTISNCTTAPTFTRYPVGCIPREFPLLDMSDDLYMVLCEGGLPNNTPEEAQATLDRLAEYQLQLTRIERLLKVATYRLGKALPHSI